MLWQSFCRIMEKMVIRFGLPQYEMVFAKEERIVEPLDFPIFAIYGEDKF